MARPKDPRAAAARVRTEVAASRLNDELETELAMGDPDPEWARRAEEARADLSGRFGGFDRLHEISTDRPVGTSESRRPRKTSSPHGGRRRSATPAAPKAPPTPAAPTGRAPAQPRKPAPRTTRRAPRVSGAGRGAGRRAFRQTGIPGAGGSTTAFTFQVLGLMIGMALLYLVLSDADRNRGGGIFASVLAGTTGVLHRFISPGDPLMPAAAKTGVQGYQSYDAAVAGGAVAGPATPGDIRGQSPGSASGALGAPPLGGFPRAKTFTNSVTTP